MFQSFGLMCPPLPCIYCTLSPQWAWGQRPFELSHQLTSASAEQSLWCTLGGMVEHIETSLESIHLTKRRILDFPVYSWKCNHLHQPIQKHSGPTLLACLSCTILCQAWPWLEPSARPCPNHFHQRPDPVEGVMCFVHHFADPPLGCWPQ